VVIIRIKRGGLNLRDPFLSTDKTTGEIQEEKEVLPMAKSLSCRDVGSDCDFIACGNTEQELFEKVKEHARTDHNLSEIPKDLYDKACSCIRDVQQC